jgi:tetratricopeptide (TPR) repeat protein
MQTPDTVLNLGIRHYRAGELVVAEEKFRQLLNREPNNILALNILGIICLGSDRFDESITLIQTALKIKPKDHQALANLALAKQRVGDLKAAIHALEKSLSLVPNNVNALNNLGSLYRDTGNIARAEQCYQGALDIDPNHVDSLLNFTIVERAQGRFKHSLKCALRAFQIAPERVQVGYQIARTYAASGDYQNAIKWYEKALQQDPAAVDSWIGLIDVLRESGRVDECQQTLDALRAQLPQSEQAHFAQGLLHQQCGDATAAAEYFSLAIAAQPNWSKPHYYRLQLKGRVALPSELAQIDELPQTGHLEADVYRHFASATAHEQRGHRNSAFNAWLTGNALKAQQSSFDINQREDLYRTVARHTRRALERDVEPFGRSDARPLFIIGMPRSGTTLAGQILSSHSKVNGYGETRAVHDMTLRAVELGNKPYPEVIESLSQDELKSLGESLLAQYANHNLQTNILDVTPTNFQHLGLIVRALPQARFIHCCRNPVDTCFSIFKLPFPQGQDYAHDLKHLGQQYRAYWHLMQQWNELFSERIFNLCYEDLVAHSEQQIHHLCGFLALPFEPEMLQFHEFDSLVRTPSASQVRQPLYAHSVAAWRHYSNHLEPLLDALGDLVKT